MDDNYRPSRESRDSRSRSPERGYNRDRRSASPDDRNRRGGRDRSPANGHRAERAQRDHQTMANNRENSQQDRRVYVGNLAYDVKWHHLKDFMRSGKCTRLPPTPQLCSTNTIFTQPVKSSSQTCSSSRTECQRYNVTAGSLAFLGMRNLSIVEYSTREEAQAAISDLSNQTLMGRMIYVREDRETEPRFSSGAPARGGFDGGFGGARGGYGGGMGYGGGAMGGPQKHQIFVSNLPYQVGWQDLKDLFRQAVTVGAVIRADVHQLPDGRPKGTGVVAFDNPTDAQNAIQQFNGYDWQGRPIEVREDRYAGAGFGGRGGFGGGMRGGFQPGFQGRGGFAGGFGGRGGYGGGFQGARGGFGGGFRGGFQGAQGGDAPSGPASQVASNPFTDNATSGGEPGPTIYVRNLPWSTTSEDLNELFVTIGSVKRAEISYEPNGRSRGSGVVEFESQEDAATSIAKFQNYQYGGRPLGLSYVKYPTVGGGPDMMEGTEHTASIQEQMM
ncbi:RNA-binding domain-containing protein [Acrodontium crateriforme]|uniref:RNA-binding domain-containing protein n=1 Tax=Acrodontium crateriforme TaxID=150365 RepID=A0AAQ3R3X4_9PEZI|nr:RNA-binding domain-containing protein [Acrodontium crateriforme]